MLSDIEIIGSYTYKECEAAYKKGGRGGKEEWIRTFSNAVKPGDFVYSVSEDTFLLVEEVTPPDPSYAPLSIKTKSRILDRIAPRDRFTENARQWYLDDRAFYDIYMPLREAVVSKKRDNGRKDFCYNCDSAELYWHMMVAKCCSCNKIILGG